MRSIRVLAAMLGIVTLCGCDSFVTFEQAEATARAGDYKRAVEMFTVLARSSEDPAVFGNRGNCYSYLGQFSAAIADYQKALELIEERSPLGGDPLLPYIFYNRGLLYVRAHKFADATVDFEKTLQIQPDYPDVKNHLAWLLATCPDARVRNPTRAVELANEELKRAPTDASILDTVAASYAAAGDFEQAIAMQEKAISLLNDEPSKLRFSARRDLYRDQQPFLSAE